jgi:hypothetical protein
LTATSRKRDSEDEFISNRLKRFNEIQIELNSMLTEAKEVFGTYKETNPKSQE